MHSRDTADRKLVQAAASGSVDAWHEFIDRYSGLIHALICRYLSYPDEEERKSIYVDVLESLYEGGLERYDGRATVSTWIGVVTRSRCMDHLRKQHGRRQAPTWLEGLSAEDQEVYRLYYLEGQGFSELCRNGSGNGPHLSVDNLTDALDRIDAHLDRGSRRRMAYELEARSVTGASGRLLEYLEYSRQQAEHARATYQADLAVVARETRQLIDRLQGALEKLENEEREVIRLRFSEGLEAREVAERMDLPASRRVYTITDRAVRKLRLLLGDQGAQL
jgi:DNA-directed RNA polymerase specialized sigma24 family protein